ncbi:DeoR family transcriptional regulator [Caldibacillus thermoamylovorans]|uniref:DeoR family transcriptional regulator n=1 Tax=Caldibacillus thermoamylovorans TaxID=35841 RepID=UPI001D070357|nr:DeoR family transcriptional regulator [Caldibacillus thermoamylovorans]MCB5936674.1 DeoR family transcriptional regulator [Bacillus sp. DFI.2.34]MCB7078208.1 DeoR family transcriptional regulator [Caldibacillus thermoamylovorans]
MLKINRYRVILDSLDENNIIKVSNLVNLLKVTETTIRLDFKRLEKLGLLVRVRGGAKKRLLRLLN